MLTSNRGLWLSMQKKCPGHPDHVECRGPVAQASAYYPRQMVVAAVKAIVGTWTANEDWANVSLAKDAQWHLLEVDEAGEQHTVDRHVRNEEPAILALSRQRYPREQPTGKALQKIKQTMLRIHRASGHSSMSNLQQLLRTRQAPEWAVALAGQVECPECIEARRPRPSPPASTGEQAGLFEQVGSDVFELEFNTPEVDRVQKAKFILWRDRASGLAQVDLLQVYGGEVRNWEPRARDVIKSFGRWLLHNPTPKWIITDPATYYTSSEVLEYMGRSGIGVMTTPAEAHWVLGAEEGCIGILKATFKRLMKETPNLGVEDLMYLAVHGHNQTIGPSGFSPFQWTRGASAPEESLPVGLNPNRAFEGMLKLKARAKVAYEMEHARSRMSKLSNATGRPPNKYQTGALVMVWRQRMRPGKVSGHWAGPLRVLLQEGSTLWLATGSNLIKAKVNQVRHVTKREELQASLEGTAILRMPVTVESLLRDFTGKHFTNICGEVPSELQRQQDVAGTTVLVEPQGRIQPDSWKIENGKWLVRVHNAPRLALFSPARNVHIPIGEDQLTGTRRAVLKPLVDGAAEVIIEDNYREEADPHRLLQERWTGETRFEISTSQSSLSQQARKKARKDIPAKESVPAVFPPTGPQAEADEGELLPNPRDEGLNEALRERGPNAVDGIPATPIEGGHSDRQPMCSWQLHPSWRT